jgi:sarcosine/dimethylglycine N-methyltransferase
MAKQYTDKAVKTAQQYYNSTDADSFYFNIWGGEDIHIGLYRSQEESIFGASRRTVERMASFEENLDSNSKILDIGAGYGGAARYLAKNFGCKVVALNLSEVENERNRQMNKQQGLDNLIGVVDASFEEIPFEDNSFDLVWSQDAILHSDNRDEIVKEVARVLRKDGDFIFTDPMMADDCPEDVLQPIFDRLHLESLASPGFYRKACRRHGLQEQNFEDHTDQLPLHYYRVLKETEKNEDELEKNVSREYIDNMKTGLQHWVKGGNNGYLCWGIFHFRKQ